MKPFPTNNVVGKSKIDRNILKSEQWEAAKNVSDIEAAKDIVGNLWSEKKTDRLKNLIKSPQKALFISQPSTSGTNVIPIVFARELSLFLETSSVVGDQYFKSGHQKLVKCMTLSERTFERRIYVPHDESELKKLVSGKGLIVVDDLLTSGGSVADFTRALEYSGAEVVSVVALMGDKRLNIDQLTKDKLETALNDKNIDVSADKISNIVTRSQAGRMIQLINNVRNENARKKITERIQGILDQGPFKSMERDTKPPRHESSNRNDFGDERVFERIKTWSVRETGRDTEYEIIIENDGNVYKKKSRIKPGIKDRRSFLSREAKGFAFQVSKKYRIPDIQGMKVRVRPIRANEKQIGKSKTRGIEL